MDFLKNLMSEDLVLPVLVSGLKQPAEIAR